MRSEQMTAAVHFILCNHPQPDGSRQKKSVNGRVYIHPHGIETEDSIKEHFDDTDCALMNYAFEHYNYWRARYPIHSALFKTPGVFGENLSTTGITEQTVCLGDIFQIGTALLQISWGREACNTMAERLKDLQAPVVMHQQSRNGWFYRVLQAGEMQKGTMLTLIERPCADWTLSRVQNIIFNFDAKPEELDTLSKLGELATPWRNIAIERLNSAC
ncbi:TPA: MOSC domain-containing protein [Yersinia enterocolitica]